MGSLELVLQSMVICVMLFFGNDYNSANSNASTSALTTCVTFTIRDTSTLYAVCGATSRFNVSYSYLGPASGLRCQKHDFMETREDSDGACEDPTDDVISALPGSVRNLQMLQLYSAEREDQCCFNGINEFGRLRSLSVLRSCHETHRGYNELHTTVEIDGDGKLTVIVELGDDIRWEVIKKFEWQSNVTIADWRDVCAHERASQNVFKMPLDVDFVSCSTSWDTKELVAAVGVSLAIIIIVACVAVQKCRNRAFPSRYGRRNDITHAITASPFVGSPRVADQISANMAQPMHHRSSQYANVLTNHGNSAPVSDTQDVLRYTHSTASVLNLLSLSDIPGVSVPARSGIEHRPPYENIEVLADDMSQTLYRDHVTLGHVMVVYSREDESFVDAEVKKWLSDLGVTATYHSLGTPNLWSEILYNFKRKRYLKCVVLVSSGYLQDVERHTGSDVLGVGGSWTDVKSVHTSPRTIPIVLNGAENERLPEKLRILMLKVHLYRWPADSAVQGKFWKDLLRQINER